jgi:hypothetical protein
MNEPSWQEFETKSVTPIDDSIAQLAARVLGGGEGDKFLQWLRTQTKEMALGPEASDSALRHLEGQRALVSRIEALVARGRKAMATPR